jgi:hypothetical protein
VTDDFVRYAQPLIGADWVRPPVLNGIHRFARLQKLFAPKKCRAYVPMAYREKK